MQVKMLKQKIINGSHAKVGEIVEVNELDAKFLVGTGSADHYAPPKTKAKRKSRNHNV